MKISRSLLKSDERANLELRNLYQKFGYRQFKMGKFEEYDLYVKNKEFLQIDSMITFNDNGKLMALKPDLTLSIIKNYHHSEGYIEKVYYSENIYRASKSSHTYKEIMQTGLECMGDIDLYHICEVTALAAKSLAAISPSYVLEISHMGVIKAVLAPLEEELKRQVLKCIAEKNLHEIRSLCAENGIEDEIYQSIETLVSTYGGYKKVLTALKKSNLSGEVREALNELETICSILAVNRLAKNINIDFSIVNDMGYYSGILYKGFVKGIPNSILSGGQYNQLMARMGKKAGAIGFAVYLDALDRLDSREKVYDFDVVFLYDEKSDLRFVMKEAKEMRDKGESVLLQRSIPAKMTYRKLLKLEDGEVKILERND
ncbi:ATP phosphoribosyltransferase regulatory subunit [Anaerovoracaceae bacterium 42-11]